MNWLKSSSSAQKAQFHQALVDKRDAIHSQLNRVQTAKRTAEKQGNALSACVSQVKCLAAEMALHCGRMPTHLITLEQQLTLLHQQLVPQLDVLESLAYNLGAAMGCVDSTRALIGISRAKRPTRESSAALVHKALAGQQARLAEAASKLSSLDEQMMACGKAINEARASVTKTEQKYLALTMFEKDLLSVRKNLDILTYGIRDALVESTFDAMQTLDAAELRHRVNSTMDGIEGLQRVCSREFSAIESSLARLRQNLVSPQPDPLWCDRLEEQIGSAISGMQACIQEQRTQVDTSRLSARLAWLTF